MYKVKSGCLLLLSWLLISGCAIHAPMSEMVMFKDKKVDGKEYESRMGWGLGSMTVDLTTDKLDSELCEGQTGDCVSGDEPSLNTHVLVLTEKLDRVALSVALGAPLGLDATVHVFEDYYMTGSVATISDEIQGQFIFQRRLLDGNPLGLSVGGHLSRLNWVAGAYGDNCTISCWSEHRNLNTMVAGIRSVFTLTRISSYGSTRPFLYLTGSYNYDFKVGMTYPKVGVAIGFY